MPSSEPILATFPIDDRSIMVLFSSPELAEEAIRRGLRLLSGRAVRVHEGKGGPSAEVRLEVAEPPAAEVVVDQVVVDAIDGPTGPRFIHGVRAPLELKAPFFEPRFPYGSTLAGVHVTVSCCTGCNGGVHDRGLVVLNNHTGGGFSGIWVHTAIDLPPEYARWQKIVFLGGVLREENGSTTVVDDGWMRVRLGNEDSHEPPRPVRVTTALVPAAGTETLLARSLDACWVEFDDIVVVRAREVAPAERPKGEGVQLPRKEIEFTDASGATAVAWLYQKSALALEPDDRVATLRGFIHAESPGRYVLLGDKDEDLIPRTG